MIFTVATEIEGRQGGDFGKDLERAMKYFYGIYTSYDLM